MLSVCCEIGIRLSPLYVLYMIYSVFIYGVLYVYIDMIEIHEYVCVSFNPHTNHQNYLQLKLN